MASTLKHIDNSGNELSTKYFSRDFPADVEIEWKASLDTYYPMGFINWLEESLENQSLPSLRRTRSLGRRSAALSYQSLIHHYYGYRATDDELRQAFVLVQLPGSTLFAPHIKLDDGRRHTANILSRQESKPGIHSFRQMSERDNFISHFTEETGLQTEYVGTMSRQRIGTFATSEDERNWSIVADHVQPLGNAGVLGMAQVEVEYKGRNGVWLEQNLGYQHDTLSRLTKIGHILTEASGIIHPTNETKFEWLKKYNENIASR